MEYQLLKRTKYSGSTPDSLVHQKTSKTLKKAIEYKIALIHLLEDYEKDRASFEICINIYFKSSCTINNFPLISCLMNTIQVLLVL